MRLQILHVPDCPNVTVLEQRLHEAFRGCAEEVEIEHREVDDPVSAAELGMAGSPTLLVDGVDPFAEPGQAPSVSCRLYRDEDGRPVGAPSVAALRRALATEWNGIPRESCCEAGEDSGSSVLALSTALGRAVPSDPVERAVHRAVLLGFAEMGSPPAVTDLAGLAEGHGVSIEEVLVRLHAADVVRVDSGGRVEVAYPFSARPRRQRVRLATGTQVYAMCAIDALGMPEMLGIDATITGTDPDNGEPIVVTVRDGRYEWRPTSAVVFVGAVPGGGPSAESCCDYLNLFVDRTSAQAWSRAHPGIVGEVVGAADAEQLGRRIFGTLLWD